jgi:membrane protein YfhO
VDRPSDQYREVRAAAEADVFDWGMSSRFRASAPRTTRGRAAEIRDRDGTQSNTMRPPSSSTDRTVGWILGLEWNTGAAVFSYPMVKPDSPKATRTCVVWLSLAIVAFYWQIVFTSQFSMLTVGETVNQAYSWFHFWAESVRHGSVPLWDPYTFAGHSFIGEMQTAAFYPLHLVFALFPANGNSLLSTRLYHLYFVFTHLLAAYFMFALIREMGLKRFPALVAGLCYSLGGFVGSAPWPHLLDSAVWLPLQFLLTLRALQAPSSRQSLICAALGGLTLGTSILAGGLHMVMMQVIVLISAAGYYASRNRNGWWRPAAVVAVLAITGLAAGAVQLLPSAEYSARAIRFISGTSLPATQKIPIAYLVDSFWPSSVLSYLFAWNSQDKMGPGEALSPYLGVFPLLLAIIGFWTCREHSWVRYSAGLALGAFLFSLGAPSLLYGLIYALVPLLWMAREASRFLYIAHFGLVILAAYGAQTLFYDTECASEWTRLNRILAWLAIASAIVWAIPYVFGQLALKPWIEWSLLFIILTYPLFRYVSGGGIGNAARFLVVAFILFDLHLFGSVAFNKIEEGRKGADQLERLISMRGAADFLKSQPGPFRVQVMAPPELNIGDSWGIETLNGGAVTLAANFLDVAGKGDGADLLNVRYFLKPVATADPNPVYADANWKIYANPTARPRAWLEGAAGLAGVEEHSARHIAVKVTAAGSGTLVLSEMYYPGWEARVNGTAQRIDKVHGGLRGIPVPRGESLVTVDYAPLSVMLGGILTLLTFALTLFAAAFWGRPVASELQ